MSGEGSVARRRPEREHARRREQGGPASAAAQEPAGQASRGAPVEGVLLAIESGMADATCAKWRVKGGERGRAIALLRRAQRQLARAEIRLIELEHQAVHDAARRG